MHDGDSESRRRSGTYKDETWVEKSEERSWHLTFSYVGSRAHLQVEVKNRSPSMDHNATLRIGAVKSVTVIASWKLHPE